MASQSCPRQGHAWRLTHAAGTSPLLSAAVDSSETTKVTAGSSEALLQGHKSCFKLLARATQGEGRRHVSCIRPAISEAFAVATTRTRGAVKADIPHVEEHVCRLEKVGKETHSKLQDIRAAAKTVGISNLDALHNRVDKGAFPCMAVNSPLCLTEALSLS